MVVCPYRTNEGNNSDFIRKYEDVIKKKSQKKEGRNFDNIKTHKIMKVKKK